MLKPVLPILAVVAVVFITTPHHLQEHWEVLAL
jgi:hypothetical protein